MKKVAVFLVIFCVVINFLCINNQITNKNNYGKASTIDYNDVIKQDILCLMIAYPGIIVNVQKDTSDNVYIVMKSGKRIIYNDKKSKTIDENFKNPDIKFSMKQIYPLKEINGIMGENYGPGRARVYDIFNEAYGESKKQVETNLIGVKFGSKFYTFNKCNGAAKALNEVVKELMVLINKNANIKSFVFPISGTYNYRLIQGTDQLSPHSYGIAIDLSSKKAGYWRWMTKKSGDNNIKVYPREIIKIFERNNFIWAGKWGHFDTMHFEYRPELIYKSKYFREKYKPGDPWYKGVPINNLGIKNYINKINSVFRYNN